MNLSEAMLERFTKDEVHGNWWGTWTQRVPKQGLSFYQAVAISRWCADQYAGQHNGVAKWFSIFNQSMGSSGYGFVNMCHMRAPLHVDPGLVAKH
jgi:hypothetical protein